VVGGLNLLRLGLTGVLFGIAGIGVLLQLPGRIIERTAYSICRVVLGERK
jgi:hypothetical protein